ncbi:unnamed protein product [Closterium sp. Yama58-4]|nr:unnamed protein product [Closterium sp. Yama58-4]
MKAQKGQAEEPGEKLQVLSRADMVHYLDVNDAWGGAECERCLERAVCYLAQCDVYFANLPLLRDELRKVELPSVPLALGLPIGLPSAIGGPSTRGGPRPGGVLQARAAVEFSSRVTVFGGQGKGQQEGPDVQWCCKCEMAPLLCAEAMVTQWMAEPRVRKESQQVAYPAILAELGAGRQAEEDCFASMLVQVLGVKENADLKEGFGVLMQNLLTGGLEKAHAEEKGRGGAGGEARNYNWDGTDPRYGGESHSVRANHPAGHGQGHEEAVELGEPVDALMDVETQPYSGSPDLGTETPATEEDLRSCRAVVGKTASEFRGGLLAPRENVPHPSSPTTRLAGGAAGRDSARVEGEKQNAGGTIVDRVARDVERAPQQVQRDKAEGKVVALRPTDVGLANSADVGRRLPYEPTSPNAASLPGPTAPTSKHGRTAFVQDTETRATRGVNGGMLTHKQAEHAEQKGGAASLAGLGHTNNTDRHATKCKDEETAQAETGVYQRTTSMGHDGAARASAVTGTALFITSDCTPVDIITGTGGTQQAAGVALQAAALPTVLCGSRAAARPPNFDTAITFIDIVERLMPIPSGIRRGTGTHYEREGTTVPLPMPAMPRVHARAAAVTRLPTFDTAIKFIDVVERLMPAHSVKRPRTDLDAP